MRSLSESAKLRDLTFQKIFIEAFAAIN